MHPSENPVWDDGTAVLEHLSENRIWHLETTKDTFDPLPLSEVW